MSQPSSSVVKAVLAAAAGIAVATKRVKRTAASKVITQTFCCYLLRSADPKHPGTTYIGFTTHPRRRIRQHNGEIRGGARKTRSLRTAAADGQAPSGWVMCAIVTGFPSKTAALQFEWAWQHPKESRAVRDTARESGLLTKRGVASKLHILGLMLGAQPFIHWPLGLHLIDTAIHAHLVSAKAPCPLPSHVAVTIGPLETMPMYVGKPDAECDDNGAEDDDEDGGSASSDTCSLAGSQASEVAAVAVETGKRKRGASSKASKKCDRNPFKRGVGTAVGGASLAAAALPVIIELYDEDEDEDEENDCDGEGATGKGGRLTQGRSRHDALSISDDYDKDDGSNGGDCGSDVGYSDGDDDEVEILDHDGLEMCSQVDADDIALFRGAAAPSSSSGQARRPPVSILHASDSTAAVSSDGSEMRVCSPCGESLARPGLGEIAPSSSSSSSMPAGEPPHFMCDACGAHAHLVCLAGHFAQRSGGAQYASLIPTGTLPCPGRSGSGVCSVQLTWPAVVRNARSRQLDLRSDPEVAKLLAPG